MEEEIKKLDNHVKDIIKDAKKFAGIGVDKLQNMKQDILSNLVSIVLLKKLCHNILFPWNQNVNWTYIGRLEGVQDVF